MPWLERREVGGWEAASCAPGAHEGPAGIDALEWMPATVPGTAAAALRDAGRWRPGEPLDLDGEDWWFRTRFEAAPAEAGEEVALRLGGIATVAQLFLDGAQVLESDSMFAAHELDPSGLARAGGGELAIRCRALEPLLGGRKPRARWRTRLADNRLRFVRTALLGRAPSLGRAPAPVGPWRPVWVERRRGLAVERLDVRTALDGGDGLLSVRGKLRTLSGEPPRAAEAVLTGPSGEHRAALELSGPASAIELRGELRVPDVARWWPHTHGEPALHEARIEVETPAGPVAIDAGRAGFRELAAGPPGHEIGRDGLDLRVNGVPVFARGAVWTPPDPVGLAPSEQELRATLERCREAGMNMLRVPGTTAYESAAFHGLCDELGILVWQDFMFANFDYPLADAAFRAAVEREAAEQLATLAGRPSLAVLCGNSEVEQQAAMLGQDPALGRGELFGELLPGLVAASGADAPYVPSAPCGGELPFRPGAGVAHYFGVGGYRRPLEDARRAGVRFAAECLAFSNAPDRAGVEEALGEEPSAAGLAGPRWKAGVQRDEGAEWDFEDVRDHYLRLLFELDPDELRAANPERYLALSRQVSGEAMAAVFGEWRRAASPCRGGIVLWLRDTAPGAGWGLLDSAGRPKAAYHHLRRALAPSAVWMTDEGLGGVAVHLAHDGAEPLRARLRVALYRDFEQPVGEAVEQLALEPRASLTRDVEGMLGRFVDASYAYRFGPPQQSLVFAALEREGGEGGEQLSQAVFLPAGRPSAVEPVEGLGLEASAARRGDGAVALSLIARRFAYGVRIEAPGLRAPDDAFSLEPGAERRLLLTPNDATDEAGDAGIAVSALNMDGRLTISPRR